MLVLIAFPHRDLELAEEIGERLEAAARKKRIAIQNPRIAIHRKDSVKQLETGATFAH
jgi:hypothetical protein